MFQNHLLQLLCMTAMEAPVRMDAESVRGEKVKVLKAIRAIPSADMEPWAVRGQYGPGVVNGEEVPGYRREEKVSPRSSTPTYAAVKFLIDNWRWAGVPFYLRSGKRLAKRTTEIAIEFREVPHMYMFFKEPTSDRLEKNVLRLKIQPDEGISLKFLAKIPGAGMRVTSEAMDFPYSQLGVAQHGGYERLLLDVMHGDATLFTRGDEVEEAWRVVAPILENWAKTRADRVSELSGRHDGPGMRRNVHREGRPALENAVGSREVRVFDTPALLAAAAASDFLRAARERDRGPGTVFGRALGRLHSEGDVRRNRGRGRPPGLDEGRFLLGRRAPRFPRRLRQQLPDGERMPAHARSDPARRTCIPGRRTGRRQRPRTPTKTGSAFGSAPQSRNSTGSFSDSGTDGHTASLFPGTLALGETRRPVAANFVPGLNAWRLTMTFPALDAARECVFLAEGAAKADVVRRILANERDLPARASAPARRSGCSTGRG